MSLEDEAELIADPFMRRGLMLAVDGTNPSTLRTMLEAESLSRDDLDESPAKVFESAGGYAPTVGILGAVLGLIHVMENLSDPNKLGAGIAVAFVATIYGVGSANLLLLPIASKLRNKAPPERQAARADPRGHPGDPGGTQPAADRPEAAGAARQRRHATPRAARGPRRVRPASAVRAIRRRQQHGSASHERWLVSYADFITLLFAFFTTMYAISTVDARKLGEVVDSMQAAFANGDVPAPTRKGGGPGGGGANLTPGPTSCRPSRG